MIIKNDDCLNLIGTVTQYISTAQPGTTLQVTNVKPVPASSITKPVPATGRRVSHPDTTTTLQSPTTPSGGYTGVVGAYMQVIIFLVAFCKLFLTNCMVFGNLLKLCLSV